MLWKKKDEDRKGWKADGRTNIHDTFNVHEAYGALIYEFLN